jgi:hypothetical protein
MMGLILKYSKCEFCPQTDEVYGHLVPLQVNVLGGGIILPFCNRCFYRWLHDNEFASAVVMWGGIRRGLGN